MLPQGYSKEELNKEDKEYVNGMEHIRDEIDNITLNYDLDKESQIDRLKAEVINGFVEHLKAYVQSEIDECIISRLDQYPDEEE